MKEKILIVAAHPDDEVLGCGGFISRFKSICDFRVVFIAEGSSCRFKDLIKDKNQIIKKINLRQTQAIKALKSLSIKKNNIKFFNLPCGRLNSIPSVQINQLIENEIKIFKPSKVMTHSLNDNHTDHQQVFKSVMQATRPVSKQEYLKEVISFEILSSSEWSFDNVFKPNFFIKLSKKNIIEKWNALKNYNEEILDKPHPRSLFGLTALANYRGLQNGTEFAEAFKIIRFFK